MTETMDQLTAEEMVELQKYVGPGAPTPDEKYSHHKFLHDVSESLDTTKTGNLDDEEVGIPKNPLRTFKRLSLICKDIMDNPYLMDHFQNEGEIITSTSLSKNAKLIQLAVIQRRQLEDVTKKPSTKKKGLFGKKEESSEQ